MNNLFTHSFIVGNGGASPRATTTTMSTVEHENENDSRLPYAPSTTTKLEEEGESGSRNPSGNWRRISNDKTGRARVYRWLRLSLFGYIPHPQIRPFRSSLHLTSVAGSYGIARNPMDCLFASL